MTTFSLQLFQRSQDDRGVKLTEPSEVQKRELSETLANGIGTLVGSAKGYVLDSAKPGGKEGADHKRGKKWP